MARLDGEHDRGARLVHPDGEDRWQIDLEVQGIGIVDTKFVQLDNTLQQSRWRRSRQHRGPARSTSPGNCNVRPGVITGRFVARDRHFGSWGLSVQGGPSSGFPTPPRPRRRRPLATRRARRRSPAATFEYDLSALPPCGYTVTLTVSDRAIVNSATAGRSTSVSRGLCIRKESE